MASIYVVALQNMRAGEVIDGVADNIATAAVRAINRTTERGRAEASREIRKQVKFSAAYLSDAQGRLTITKFASPGSLQGTITGRDRPTSLARFVQGSPRPNKPGVQVAVSGNGAARFMRRAFLIKLRAGNSDINTKNNMGLAIRLKDGERLKNKNVTLMKKSGLYLLYGPSVDQILGGPRGVAAGMTPKLAEQLEEEFFRQLELLEK